MTREMFHVDSSRLTKELEKLLGWLEHTGRPDVICLSTALLAGFARQLRARLGAPVVTFFQGEDTFLDGLPEPYRSDCWRAMGERLADSNLLLAPSRFYAGYMSQRLGLPPGRVAVLWNGIQLDGYAPAEPPAGPAVIGYLARLSREKGLEHFVEAFLHLAGPLGDRTTRVRIGGAATAGDEPLLQRLRARLEAAGVAERVEWAPNLSREAKVALLRSLTLFSVPVTYPEAFGLYVVEAMACGVPLVQPRAAAFPELVEETGAGVCVPPGDPAALARTWRDLLADPARRAELGRRGREAATTRFPSRAMAAGFREIVARLPRPS
jgi:glycosyltransferase involved in cell wall biosynthesis